MADTYHINKYITNTDIKSAMLKGVADILLIHNIRDDTIEYGSFNSSGRVNEWWRVGQQRIVPYVGTAVDYPDLRDLDEYTLEYDKEVLVNMEGVLLGDFTSTKLPVINLTNISNTVMNDLLATAIWLMLMSETSIAKAYLQSVFLLVKISTNRLNEMTELIHRRNARQPYMGDTLVRNNELPELY